MDCVDTPNSINFLVKQKSTEKIKFKALSECCEVRRSNKNNSVRTNNGGR